MGQTVVLGVSPLLLLMLHCLARLHFQNIIAKTKLLKISRWQEQSSKSNKVFGVQGPVQLPRSMPMKLVLFQMFLKSISQICDLLMQQDQLVLFSVTSSLLPSFFSGAFYLETLPSFLTLIFYRVYVAY